MMHNARVDVVREPFANCYYFGRDRRSMRYGNRPAVAHIDQSAVFARVLRSRRGKTCFVKELAFQGRPYVTDAFLGVARHLFLINTPEVVYSALVKLKPDFNSTSA